MTKNGKYHFAIVCLLLLVASCKNAAPAEGGEDAPKEVETPVTVTTISQEPMTDSLELNATSSFLLKSFVKANANGYLHAANVNLGDHVAKGKTLFTITTKEAESIGNAVNKLDSSFRFSGTNNIKAGEQGFVTQLNHHPGDYVQDGEQLAIISDLNSFVFLLDVPYELRQNITTNTSVKLLLPDGEQLAGIIVSAMPTVDSASQTQRMVIKVNANHSIPENLVAKVKIPKTIKSSAVSLPKSAVLTDETQADFWIMKMIDSNTAVKVPVKKGMELNDRVEIVSPVLSATDKILVTGNYGLADTAKVKIVTQQNQ